jgi:hypothetical protein
VGSIYYFAVQVGYFIVGFVPLLIMLKIFGPKHSILFIFGNLGAFVSGYLYVSKSFKTLFEKEIIR